MADRSIMPVALDSNGDIVSGARAYFYERGTFTPLTVYSDEAAAVPHPSPVVADSAGVFPAIFTTVGFKIDIRDTEDVSLPGYPTDPGYTSPANSVGASNVLFTPIAGNAATNVQAAIQNLTTLWNNVTTFARSLLNDSTAAEMRTTLELGNLATVDILDEDDMATDSATRPPSQQSTKAYVDAATTKGTAAAATTSGTSVNISTAIPDGVNEVSVIFSGVSMSGTDSLVVQLSAGSTFKTSGYVGESGGMSGSGQSVVTNATGFIMNVGDSAAALSGEMRLCRYPGTNKWVSSHSSRQATDQTASGGGEVTLSAALDGLRVKSSGTDTFDAGSIALRWGA